MQSGVPYAGNATHRYPSRNADPWTGRLEVTPRVLVSLLPGCRPHEAA